MQITAIVGSYHRGGMVETAVDEILAAARERGAEVAKVNLLDVRLEFCTNCQACTQEPGPERGRCTIEDDIGPVFDRIDASDAFVLASPMNFWTVTALMKRFIERTVCYAYWPWRVPAPKPRIRRKTKRAIVVVSCAAPSWLGPRRAIVKLMRRTAQLLGARRVTVLLLGLSRHEPGSTLRESARRRARTLGAKLAS